MVGKRIQIEDEMWQAINLLRQERRRSFQQLAVEALRDLLAKYDRPVRLRDQLERSLAEISHGENEKNSSSGAPAKPSTKARRGPSRTAE